MNLYISNFNNYYNRIVKKYNTIEEYRSNSTNGKDYTNINFKPNDSVNTTQIINDWNSNNSPDYCVVYDNSGISSRWFVIEFTRLRETQYQLTLRRDVIADNYNELLNSDCYIEKGIVNPTDIAIYNQEDISFNQIKKDEILLKDKTKISWIIGYVAPTFTGEITIPSKQTSYITVNTIESSEFYPFIGNYNFKYIKDEVFKIQYGLNALLFSNNTVTFNLKNNSFVTATTLGYHDKYLLSSSPYVDTNNQKTIFCNNVSNVLSNNYVSIVNTFNNNNNYFDIDVLSKYNNKIIYVANGTTSYPAGYYKTTIESINENVNDFVDDSTTELYVNNILNSAGFSTTDNFTSDKEKMIHVKISYKKIRISITSVPDYGTNTFNFSVNANNLNDAPYKMFAIPCGDIDIRTLNSLEHIKSSREEALNIVNSINLVAGINMYDVQLMPYFPITYCKILKANIIPSSIFVSNLEENKDFDFIKDSNDNVKNIIFYCRTSNFSFNIDHTINMPTTTKDKKVALQCDQYRLVSPNYSSMFEFNIVKNGSISFFNVDCTYKPITPYIHINPNFGGLYGKDFNDTRGLICTGDFSAPMIDSNWTDYQVLNKNFMNAFGRQIDNLEINQKYQKIGDIASALSGTVSGTVQGAKAGGIAGAVVGGTASMIGGVADVNIQDKLRSEAIDYTVDQFNYSLENIQARPNTLMKVGGFDYNNKIFPVLEFYSCTDEEKEIFINKMKFNGMKVMRIDKPINFIQSEETDFQPFYIKGQIIRTNINDDLHLANELANEFNKGVFTYGNTI